MRTCVVQDETSFGLDLITTSCGDCPEELPRVNYVPQTSQGFGDIHNFWPNRKVVPPSPTKTFLYVLHIYKVRVTIKR